MAYDLTVTTPPKLGCDDPRCAVCAPLPLESRPGLVDDTRIYTEREFKRRAEAFPSLSIMQQPARGFTTQSIPPLKALPAPAGAPAPRIKYMGDGLYRCRSVGQGGIVEGFGDKQHRAWNAWVNRYTSGQRS